MPCITKAPLICWLRQTGSCPSCFFHLVTGCGSPVALQFNLEVNNKASNIACRAELDRFPLLIKINQKIMKYFVYLNNKDNDSIVKQSFLMSKNQHSMNNSGYFSNFINMFEQYNLTSLDAESLGNEKIRRYSMLPSIRTVPVSGRLKQKLHF